MDENDTFVVWSDIPEEKRPAYFFDMLCLALWRQENIDTLTKSPYWTQGHPNISTGQEAMGALQEAYERQNEFQNEYDWVYLLFRDQWFGVAFNDVHGTPID